MDKIEKTELNLQIKQQRGNEEATIKETECEVLVMNYEEDYLYENEANEEANAEINDDDTCKSKLELKERPTEANIKEVEEKNGNVCRENEGLQITPYQRKRYIQKLDDPNRKLFCANCDFKAVKKHHLVNHIKQAHPRNQQPKQIIFECKHCMFSSRHKSSLMMHTSTFHIDEIGHDSKKAKKQSCYDVQGIQIEDHSKLSKNGLYSCNYCSFTTLKRMGIRQHVIMHVVEKKPVRQCPHCPARFAERVLNRHIQKVHNPEGLFKCPKCYYVTKYKNNLRRHIKRNQDVNTCAPILEKKTSVFKKKELSQI